MYYNHLLDLEMLESASFFNDVLPTISFTFMSYSLNSNYFMQMSLYNFFCHSIISLFYLYQCYIRCDMTLQHLIQITLIICSSNLLIHLQNAQVSNDISHQFPFFTKISSFKSKSQVLGVNLTSIALKVQDVIFSMRKDDIRENSPMQVPTPKHC